MRENWDSYFMGIAERVATRSTCPRAHVGAVIVKDRHIISTGYNGAPHGLPHCTDEGCITNAEGRCVRTVHAEVNAILHAREDVRGSIVYCTHHPCEACLNVLIQAGVARVIYKQSYKSPTLDKIPRGGVLIYQVDNPPKLTYHKDFGLFVEGIHIKDLAEREGMDDE